MSLQCYFVVFSCFFVLSAADQPSTCTTPNGESARCERIRSCPVFKEALYSDDPLVQKFVDESTSSCGGSMICCGISANYTQNSDKEEKTDPPPPSKREYAIKHLLPNRRICGMQHTDDYFYNETRTAVDEFPWLLVVYYDDRRRKRSPDPRPISPCLLASFVGRRRRREAPCIFETPKVTYKCTGVLISNRYALTSGSCGSDEPMKVALGQYEENKKVTCMRTSFGEDECTDPAVNVTVEERIRSPNNSLMLLRLERKIRYTDFIRPICLPMNETIRSKIDDAVFTSGWGIETINENATVVKKRIRQNIASSENCEEESSSERLCTMLESDTNYVCSSDRGGPLMYRYRTKNWYVEGVVDIKEGCVNNTVPNLKITAELVDWVLENMRD